MQGDVLLLLMLAVFGLLASAIVMIRRARWPYRVRLGRGIAWGTVYIFRDRERPGIVKVGTTRRTSRTRKREVSRTMASGAELVQAWAIDMPHARCMETVAHRLLRRHRARWRRGEDRGREWYLVPDGDLGTVIDAIEDAARHVRAEALRRRRWPADGDERARIWSHDGSAVQRSHPFLPAIREKVGMES